MHRPVYAPIFSPAGAGRNGLGQDHRKSEYAGAALRKRLAQKQSRQKVAFDECETVRIDSKGKGVLLPALRENLLQETVRENCVLLEQMQGCGQKKKWS